jgi:hypothetical protein
MNITGARVSAHNQTSAQLGDGHKSLLMCELNMSESIEPSRKITGMYFRSLREFDVAHVHVMKVRI